MDRRFKIPHGLIATLLGLAGCAAAHAQDVLTQHNDNARTGADLHEVQLNTSNVNVAHFGKLFERGVDGHIYGQPLYASAVNTPGHGARNIVYVATMHDSVYAFDADSATEASPIWMRNLGPSVALPDPNIGPGAFKVWPVTFSGAYSDISGEIGITSTPVISRKNNAIYVVTLTKIGNVYEHSLHALDLGTGQELFGGPRNIEASMNGNGDGSENGTIALVHHLHNQRAALLLSNEVVYVAFASFGDRGPWHGWVLGYQAGDLHAPPTVFNTTPDGSAGGIWQAGQGPAADDQGNLYLMTGNGDFGTDSLQAKVEIGESSNAAPALATFNNQLVLGWTGTDGHLNVISSSDGRNFGGKATLSDTGSDAPALAAGNGRLFLGWPGTDFPNHHLNVISSTDLHTFGNKVTLGETSPFAPALAFGNGRLFIAWVGGDLGHSLNVISSTDGHSFGNKVTLGESSNSAPGLAFIDGSLFLLWRGSGLSETLNIMQSSDGVHFSNKITLSESSDHAPALLKQNGLWFAWTGRNVHTLNLMTGTQPGALINKATFSDTSIAAPAMVSFKGGVLIAWTGTDFPEHHLNVARPGGPHSLGDSFIKLSHDLKIEDFFSPWNQHSLSDGDTDVGAGGLVLLPGSNLLVGGGKEGKFYLLDRAHLGGYCQTCKDPQGDTQIVQWLQATPKKDAGDHKAPMGYHHIHGSPVYWNGPVHGALIYVGGEADELRAFHLTGSRLEPAEISQVFTPDMSMPGAMMSLSANGSTPNTGILWATHPISGDANQRVVPGLVRALDASNIQHELWDSTQDAARDSLGNCSKFSAPTVANGKVYVSTFSNKLVVYGLGPPEYKGPPPAKTLTARVLKRGKETNAEEWVIIDAFNEKGQSVAATVTIWEPQTGGKPERKIASGVTGAQIPYDCSHADVAVNASVGAPRPPGGVVRCEATVQAAGYPLARVPGL